MAGFDALGVSLEGSFNVLDPSINPSKCSSVLSSLPISGIINSSTDRFIGPSVKPPHFSNIKISRFYFHTLPSPLFVFGLFLSYSTTLTFSNLLSFANAIKSLLVTLQPYGIATCAAPPIYEPHPPSLISTFLFIIRCLTASPHSSTFHLKLCQRPSSLNLFVPPSQKMEAVYYSLTPLKLLLTIILKHPLSLLPSLRSSFFVLETNISWVSNELSTALRCCMGKKWKKKNLIK